MPRQSSTAPPPADFDSDTPPPRRWPCGDPAPRHVTLPPGEDPAPTFLSWDKAGRVPEGCVLARFVGGTHVFGRPSGYEVAALNGASDRPLGRVGAAIPPAKLAGWRIVSVIQTTPQGGAWHVVLAPKGGPV